MRKADFTEAQSARKKMGRSAFQPPARAYDASVTNPSHKPRHFGSDNYAGMCPEAIASMLEELGSVVTVFPLASRTSITTLKAAPA